MSELIEYRAELLKRLMAQPPLVVQTLGAITQRPQAPADTPNQLHFMVAHIRDLEGLAFLPRIRRILTEDRPELEAFASHRWSAASYDPTRPLPDLLREWQQLRADAVSVLQGLPAAAWSRLGFHPPSGWRTLQWWVERLYAHVREHVAEIDSRR